MFSYSQLIIRKDFFSGLGNCGGFYGSKVWHSNSKYRTVVWRCNRKYDGDEKCTCPHKTDDEIKEIVVKACNQLVDMKAEVIANYQEMVGMLFDTSSLEAEQSKLEDKVNELADAM